MSDFDDEVSEGGDFSASEDEWKPNKYDAVDTSDEDSDFEDSTVNPQSDKPQSQHKNKRKCTPQSSPSPVKKVKVSKPKTTSLRLKMFNKYKPPPKTISKNINQSLSEQLKTSEYKKRKGLSSSRSESSESSVNDHLVNPNDIDLSSSYFDIKSSIKTSKDEPPNFDCNAGLRLSDSEENDDDNVGEKNIQINGMNNIPFTNTQEDNRNSEENTSKYIFNNMKTMQEFEKAKEKLKSHKLKESINEKMINNQNGNNSTDDISKLLALGEKNSSIKLNVLKTSLTSMKSNVKNSSKKHLKSDIESESDWEEVKDDNQEIDKSLMQNYNDGIQVTVQLPQYEKRNKKTADEIEASLKRRINRVIKENQLNLHKVSLLCHIAHGIYCNKILNNPILMSETLKLLPNKNCYPDGRTEIKYFESIIKWYKTVIKLKYDGMYCNFRKRPKLLTSLALQIKYKSAICKKDYVLIFIILLRAMGIQCRLVINLVTLPIRPSQNDLCSLKQKKPENTDKNAKNNENNKTNKNTKKKSNKKNKSSEDDSSSCFSDDEDDDNNDDNNAKNKIKPVTRQKEIQKNKNSTKKQSSSVSKEHDYTEPAKSSTGNSSKSSSKAQDIKTRKINIDKLKVSTDNNDKDTQKNSTKMRKVHLDKLKLSPKKPEICDEITKQKTNNIDQEIKSSDKKSTRKSTKLKVDQVPSSSISNRNTRNKEEQNKIIIKLQENERMTRSKSRSPSLLEGNDIAENKSKKTSNSEDKAEKNKKLKRHKSPLSDKDISSARKRSKNKNDMEATEIQNQKKSSDKSRPSVSSKAATKSNSSNNNRRQTRAKNQSKNDENKKQLAIPQMDGADDEVISINKSNKRTSKSNQSENTDSSNKTRVKKINLKKLKVPKERQNVSITSDSDDEFVPSKTIKKTTKTNLKSLGGEKVIDRRVLSTDEENDNDDDNKNKTKKNDEKFKNKKNMDIWIEVFSEVEDQWITIDLFKSKVHCVDSIRKSATSPVAYVFAWNNDNTLKDVSPRYCPQWNTTTRKLRIDQDWLDEAIENYIGKTTSRDIAEDRELHKMHLEKPLPTTISEYKNHPLYVLERHLLKFEVIYPPNALTLGFVRGEPVYSRSCVHICHSREIWLKSARVVKPGEKPYKIVKSRPKWDKLTQSVIKDQPLEIFGYWQTMQYEPPTAENGIVPRNAYGNVELFKKCMLPKKTVHLQLSGLNKICKKLNIDCAPAVIGFDFHQGVCHPLLDGFVVCEEYKDIVIEAWHKEKEEAERKEKEKYLQRVYGNWKKLIKGMLIKQKLKIKYNF